MIPLCLMHMRLAMTPGFDPVCRLKFFGHVIRANPSMDLNRALQACLNPLPTHCNHLLDADVILGSGQSSPNSHLLTSDWQRLCVELRTEKTVVLLWGRPRPLNKPHDDAAKLVTNLHAYLTYQLLPTS